MISLVWVFYLMIIFFALVGSIRGWQREVLALTGLIASISALNQFGYAFISNAVTIFTFADQPLTAEAIQQGFFRAQAIFHATIAFFSYQVVARLADSATGGRLGDRVREGFQKRFIGAILGAVNGYLLVGGLWSFLEFQLQEGVGYVRLPEGLPYVFPPDVISRPGVGTTAAQVANYLPLAVIDNPAWWLLFFFIAFFVVIIALV